jgi:uncharacterized membrane protein
VKLWVYAKIAGSSESNPTVTAVSGSASWIASASEYSGASDTVAVQLGGTSSSGTVATPAITTPSDDNLVVWVMGQNTDFGTVTSGPSGSTIRVNHFEASRGASIVVADKVQASAGTVSASAFTRPNAQFPAVAHTLALAPAAAPITADFTGSPTTGAAPLTVQFTDESDGDPTSWAWDFGDSGTSTDQHPEHEYTAPGSYDVELEATNAGGSDDELKAGYITVTAPEPGIEGFVVAFDDPTLEPDPTWTRLA